MVSFTTPPPLDQAQALRSSKSDRYETLKVEGAAAPKKAAPGSQSPDALESPSIRSSTASSNKRKEHPTGDEIAPKSSIQQSRARKKRRTLGDGSLLRDADAENNLVPPSAPQERSGGGHIEARLDTPSLNYEPVATPTPQTKVAITIPNSTSSPPIECGHPIHPVYKDIYLQSRCPICLLDALMNSLQSTQNTINAHGGWSQWHKDRADDDDRRLCKITTHGGKAKKRRPGHVNADGMDISYRHKKWNLVNLVSELEALSRMELIWEEKQLPEDISVDVEQVRMRKQHSATAALHWYHDTMHNGFIGRIEEDCEFFSRQHGWRLAIENDPEYPAGNSRKEKRKRRSIRKAQNKCFQSSRMPPSTIFDPTDLQRIRKRRHEGVRVSFNEDVYVRTDADVDVLRKAASLSEEVLEEPDSKKTRMSILRTTPLKLSEVADLTTSLNSGPKPTRPYNVIPLSRQDGTRRKKGQMKRNKPHYRRGPWAAPKGSELIDTSGQTREFVSHFEMMENLQEEAAKMDSGDLNDEKDSDGDIEMEAAPVIKPEAAPQPSLPLLEPRDFGDRLWCRFTSHWLFC